MSTEADWVIHAKSREDLERLRVALLFAASDMAQTRAACDALLQTTDDLHLARALETAIAVCYARAFTTSNLRRLDAAHEPVDPADVELHRTLLALRDAVYAHTDPVGGRTIKAHSVVIEGEIARTATQEEWHPLDRELLEPIKQLCENQARLYTRDAARIAVATAQLQQQQQPAD